MSFAATVVIAVKDDVEGLKQTLCALARQSIAEPFEVIVVDDGSSDATPDTAEGRTGVRLVRHGRSLGSYASRNTGLELAAGEVVAVTDAGCIPDPSWLEAAVERLRTSTEDVLAGHIAMPLGPRPTLASLVDVVHHLDQRRYVETSGFAVTANLVTRRTTFTSVGLFNAELRSSGDAEWTRRATAAGHRLVYAPDVVVTHPPRVTASEMLTKARRVGRGNSALRQVATIPMGRPPYLQRSTYWPRHRRTGRARLDENGASVGLFRWLAVGVAQMVLLQLPQAWSALTADVALVLESRRQR